jgi:WD40 repeat protein
MSSPEADHRLERQFAELFASYDEDLAAGTVPPSPDLTRIPPLIASDLWEARSRLCLLEQVFPRSASRDRQAAVDGGLKLHLLIDDPGYIGRFRIIRRLSGGDYTVRVWDAASARELRILLGHDRTVHGVALGPDGPQIASGGGG